MALFQVAVFALLVAAVYGAPNRIVGGELTTIDKYPSIVQVEFRSGLSWSQSCAASIINNRNVLSAAHCFNGLTYSGPSSRRIRAGSSNRNVGGFIYDAENVINHPSYTLLRMDGDISVVRLSSTIQYSDVVAPVPIIGQGIELPDNLPVVHAGWGTTASGGASSPQLRDVTIYTINRELCRERYLTVSIIRRITDNMICAGILDVGGRDACQGDSGGPLYYGNMLVGVVSWGQGCADPFFPGVSAAVSPFTNWIVANAV